MIDRKDTQTIDAFPAKRRGRPATSSPDKRKADTAARVARHRAAQKRKTVVMSQVVERLASPDAVLNRSSWIELAAFVNGIGENFECRCEYLTPSGRDGSKSTVLSTFCDLIEKGYTKTRLTP